MKKIIQVLSLFVLVFVLNGCNVDGGNQQELKSQLSADKNSLSEPKPDSTVYSVFCANLNATLDNCASGYAGGRTNFIVDGNNKQVTTWVSDVTPINYVIAHRCTITDKNNWSCIYDDDKNSSMAFGFRDGVYFTSSPFKGITELYVSYEQWLKIKDNSNVLKN